MWVLESWNLFIVKFDSKTLKNLIYYKIPENVTAKKEEMSSGSFRDQAAYILRSTRRRGMSGETILRDYLIELGESQQIKGCDDFERVASSLEILYKNKIDGMKVVSDYITRSEPKQEKPTNSANNWWDE